MPTQQELKAMFMQDESLFNPQLMGRDPGFGEPEGLHVGQIFDGRKELRLKNLHVASRAGVAGSVTEGARSIVLNGGYEDDIDKGDFVQYTGAGGQSDEWGAVQVADQAWGDSQSMLWKSHHTQKPVRVFRGPKVNSNYAPIKGFRYDGLYHVTNIFETTGKQGFRVFIFYLQRNEGQKPLVPRWPEPTPTAQKKKKALKAFY